MMHWSVGAGGMQCLASVVRLPAVRSAHLCVVWDPDEMVVFRSALARKVTQRIVHASAVCRHVHCWLHFLRTERLDRLLSTRTLKAATRYCDSFAD
jgi:hypothetical protein